MEIKLENICYHAKRKQYSNVDWLTDNCISSESYALCVLETVSDLIGAVELFRLSGSVALALMKQ